MKISIRTKLTLIIGGIVLFFVGMSLLLTNMYLEKFYIWQKKDIVINSGRYIDSIYTGNPEDTSLELEKVSNTLGAGIIIFSSDGQILKYSSFGPLFNKKFPNRFMPAHKDSQNHEHVHSSFAVLPPAPPHIIKENYSIDDHCSMQLHQDVDLKIDFLVLEYQLKNGDLLVIRQPLAAVSESSAVTIRFMLFTALLSLMIGSIFAFLLAKKFTRPIFDLNRITQRMAKLDFSQKCTIDYGDEFGELGSSINHMSDQLDAAITELSQRNKELMADVEKERRLDKMRKEFVSSVSHELKTPLALILGYAEGLKENVAADRESRDYYCSVIIDESCRMDRLVKSLLNLSQLESGAFELANTSFDLTALIAATAQKYQHMLAERGVTIDLQLNGPATAFGDELLIEQVLLNFISNAINHAAGEKRITISTSKADKNIHIDISNTGDNIPDEALDKLWTSFYKVDKARTRAYGGYGLGLSIVSAILQLHHSSYGVSNRPDGVVFWFEIATPPQIS